MNRSMQEGLPLAACEMEMFGITHAEIGANWLKENEFPNALVEAVAQHEAPARISRRALLSHALVSANHLVKQIGIGYSGNAMLHPHPWEQLPSTRIIWEARGNKEYEFDDFTRDILDQFESFPDLV
jgi:HD-like signal output (HDOD) protein